MAVRDMEAPRQDVPNSRVARLEKLERAGALRRARMQAMELRCEFLQVRVAELALERELPNLVSPVPSAEEVSDAPSTLLRLQPLPEGDEGAGDVGGEGEGKQPPAPLPSPLRASASARWRGSLHAGWLWKEGDGLLSADFKHRYFVLEQTIVRYYEQQPELGAGQASVALRTTSGTELAKGMFDVRGAVIGQPKNPRKGHPFCLRVDLQKRDRHMRRKYILAAETQEEVVMWAAKLTQASAGLVDPELPEESGAPDTSLAGAYDVIRRCVVRAECELESTEVEFLAVGQVVQVFESRVHTSVHSTQTRARVSNGWVSVVSSSGDLILQRRPGHLPPYEPGTRFRVLRRVPAEGSEQAAALEPGAELVALESRVAADGIIRIRVRAEEEEEEGWYTTATPEAETILEVVEAVPPERATGLQSQPEPEPEPEPGGLDRPAALFQARRLRDFTWTESLSSMLGRDWHPATDRIRKKGPLRIVEEEVGWMAVFSDRAERRDRRASVTASTIAPEYTCELDGLNFRWMTQGDSPSTIGMVQLDVASISQLNVDQSNTRVIAIPGYYLCAETHADAVDWLMSMVFNCQTAVYAQRCVRERRLAPPDAEEIRSVEALLHERANGGLSTAATTAGATFSPRTAARQAQAGSTKPVLLGVEVYRGPPQHRQSEADRGYYAALDGDIEVHVELQLQEPAARGSVWRTVHQTEPQLPRRVVSALAPDETAEMRAVSFCVMLSFDVPSVLNLDLTHRPVSQQLRLQVCRTSSAGNSKAVGEPFKCNIADLIQSDSHYFTHRIDLTAPTPGSPPVKQPWPLQDQHGNPTGAHLGVRVYQSDTDTPAAAPAASTVSGFQWTGVVKQSYMVPVERRPPEDGLETAGAVDALREVRDCAGQKMFFDAPVVGVDSTVPGFIVTEHLRVPRAALEVPVCYLEHRMEELRNEILENLEKTKIAATPAAGEPRRVLSAEEELRQYSRICTLQQTMKKTLMLLPWYSSSLSFYKDLLSRSTAEGPQEAFLKTSTLKKDRDWAFVATNLCHHDFTVDCSPSGETPAGVTATGGLPLYSGVTSGVQAAHCEGFDLMGETGVGLFHMHQMCEQHKRLLAAAAQRTEHNLRPVSAPAATGIGGEAGGGGRPRMLTHMEDAAVPEQRISNVVDQLENRVQSRTDIVLCQLLSTVVAAFIAMFQTAQNWRTASEAAAAEAVDTDTGPLRFMRALERTGMFYIQFESLLSTRKNERGMIEDLFYVIDRCMPGIELRCCRAERDGCLGFDSSETDRFIGTRVLRIGLSEVSEK